jgi:hypothetical protein
LLKLGGKLSLRVFERGGPRKVLGQKTKAVRRDYIFHDGKLYALFWSKDISRKMIPRMV